MGYKIVAVNPLKPFPLLSFGLANVVSFGDAKSQIRERFVKAGLAEINANVEIQQLSFDLKETNKKIALERIEQVKKDLKQHSAELFIKIGELSEPISAKHDKAADEEIALLNVRWAEGKIEPALKLHLTRQEKRLAHFKIACRFSQCCNPHSLGSAYFRRFGRDASRGSSAPKSTLKTSAQGTRRHPLQFFCGSHRWLKSQMKTEDYAKFSDPQYRIKIA